MYKIKTLNKISPRGLERLDAGTYRVDAGDDNPDAYLVRSYKMHDMAFNPELKAIARAGAGTNNIPVDAATEAGIVVFNTPGANANSVKELVIMSLFLSSRKIARGIQWAESLKGKGSEVSKLVEKGKSNFAGNEIKGKTLGVIGLGAIGVMVANDAVSLKMDVMGYDPFLSVDAAWGLSRKVRKAASLEALLEQSDYITIHIPLNDNTAGYLGWEEFGRMKKGVKILNYARGGLVDRESLLKGLEDGTVDRYVTDFPEDELLGLENVIPIPHLGASTPEAEENCAVMAVEQLRDFLETGNIRNSVNFPDCEMALNGDHRLLIANRNIPNMVGQITHILAEQGINIANMLNRNHGNYAYNIIDIEGSVGENTLSELNAIEGVVMTRLIHSHKQ